VFDIQIALFLPPEQSLRAVYMMEGGMIFDVFE
jgi:hypothetical protein